MYGNSVNLNSHPNVFPYTSGESFNLKQEKKQLCKQLGIPESSTAQEISAEIKSCEREIHDFLESKRLSQSVVG